MGGPGSTLIGKFVDEELASQWSQRSSIEVEGAFELFAGGEAGIESGSSQQVECWQDLGQDFVPCGEGKIGIGAAKISNEVVLEGSDGAFRSVAAM